MSIHEVIFNPDGQIERAILRDRQIHDASPDEPSDLPTIRTREPLREGYDYGGGEFIERTATRVKQLQADRSDHVIYTDYVEGLGEDRRTITRVMISKKLYSGKSINEAGIVLNNRTFMWTPTDVFVAPKTE